MYTIYFLINISRFFLVIHYLSHSKREKMGHWDMSCHKLAIGLINNLFITQSVSSVKIPSSITLHHSLRMKSSTRWPHVTTTITHSCIFFQLYILNNFISLNYRLNKENNFLCLSTFFVSHYVVLSIIIQGIIYY